ncbi:uncharacterized protein EV154DRAFT_488374 [Mucor mucedo]|uniref:uncharacterized protein n=1 Tax=Mucor mucedo TaxID=29922 RepID=UPI002220962C|nr:uncharacterized protein EV154DRAFT_488374 [Mucor mucedo]KAI7867218.1 hypothetical protein EV154DRAFT_488374 [Mucor mucedo]
MNLKNGDLSIEAYALKNGGRCSLVQHLSDCIECRTGETTTFKIQFPREFAQETSKAHFNESKNSFQDFDLNIGWSLATENSYKPNKGRLSKLMTDDDHEHDRRIVKSCLGATECLKSSCPFYRKATRTLTREAGIKNKVNVISATRF